MPKLCDLTEEDFVSIRRRGEDMTIAEFEQWAGARLQTENRDRLMFEHAVECGFIQMQPGETMNDCIMRVWADANNGSQVFRNILENRR